ncbi:unnamed protein product, partial [Gulo gulo]
EKLCNSPSSPALQSRLQKEGHVQRHKRSGISVYSGNSVLAWDKNLGIREVSNEKKAGLQKS